MKVQEQFEDLMQSLMIKTFGSLGPFEPREPFDNQEQYYHDGMADLLDALVKKAEESLFKPLSLVPPDAEQFLRTLILDGLNDRIRELSGQLHTVRGQLDEALKSLETIKTRYSALEIESRANAQENFRLSMSAAHMQLSYDDLLAKYTPLLDAHILLKAEHSRANTESHVLLEMYRDGYRNLIKHCSALTDAVNIEIVTTNDKINQRSAKEDISDANTAD